MKKIMVILIYILWAEIASAQKEQLSLDEHNKYIFYQVDDTPGLAKDTLLARAINFCKTTYPKAKLNANLKLNNVIAKGKIVVYGGASILKHENGELNYLFTIECKDQKYRYWLTGFTFTPYQRDRYGNFVPQPGVEIPLERLSAKLDKRDADSYVSEAGAFCKQLGDKLKFYTVHAPAPKKEELTKKIVTDKW